jgi:hypothetical protein
MIKTLWVGFYFQKTSVEMYVPGRKPTEFYDVTGTAELFCRDIIVVTMVLLSFSWFGPNTSQFSNSFGSYLP